MFAFKTFPAIAPAAFLLYPARSAEPAACARRADREAMPIVVPIVTRYVMRLLHFCMDLTAILSDRGMTTGKL
jgi:hypothetical protein